MLKNIYYYLDGRGNNPVRQFIDKLSLKEQAKVFAYIVKLLNQGHDLRRPMADYLGNGIYGLRPKNNRLFYFFFLKDSAVLIHAIKKKTNKIPIKDLSLCIKRKYKVEKHKNIEIVRW